jgi:hypothetical protein
VQHYSGKVNIFLMFIPFYFTYCHPSQPLGVHFLALSFICLETTHLTLCSQNYDIETVGEFSTPQSMDQGDCWVLWGHSWKETEESLTLFALKEAEKGYYCP